MRPNPQIVVRASLPILLAALISLPSLAGAVENVEFCRMGGAIERVGGHKASALIKEYLKDKQIVFAEGILGKTKTGFADNIAAIREIDTGVPITRLGPPPKVAIDQNLRYILSELRKAAKKHPGRKIILIGMCKAGAEFIQLAVHFPEIFEAQNRMGFVVDKVVPMNATIGGTILADLALDTDPKTTDHWERYIRDNNLEDGPFKKIIKSTLLHLMMDTRSPGFRSLSTQESRVRNDKLMKMISTNERAALAHKILFVTSSRDGKDPKDAPAYTARLAGFLMSKRVPNDGLLYEKDQKIPGLGEHLMSIRKASHFNLTADFGPADCRKDFTRFLILKLATSAQP